MGILFQRLAYDLFRLDIRALSRSLLPHSNPSVRTHIAKHGRPNIKASQDITLRTLADYCIECYSTPLLTHATILRVHCVLRPTLPAAPARTSH